MTEQKKPAVSVIVPVYGVEAYLPGCLDSILAQSFRDFELILVDDGSPDGCPEICDRYAEQDLRVRVIHKKNGGVSRARNVGLDLARGEWITFCDSDDGYEPQWLMKLWEAAGSDADVVVAGHKKIRPDGASTSTEHEVGEWNLDTPEKRLRYCTDRILSERHGWEIWSRLFRGSLLRSHGVRFCETCGNLLEDLGFLLHASLYARRVVCIPETGYCYNLRETSMMGTTGDTPKLDSANEISLEFQGHLRRAVSPELAELYGPVFHFLIMMSRYSVAIRLEDYHHIGRYLDEIRRKAPWQALTREILSRREILTEIFGKIPAGRIVIYSRYCLHRCWLRFKVERFLFFKLNGYRG